MELTLGKVLSAILGDTIELGELLGKKFGKMLILGRELGIRVDFDLKLG